MEEFLIGTGIALLLAISGWGEQIKSLHKETLEAERDFSNRRKVDWNHVKKILRTNSPACEKIAALNKLLKLKSTRRQEDLQIINSFYNLGKERIRLDKLFNIKYVSFILLALLFFLSGIVNYFTETSSIITILKADIPKEFIPLMICILFSMGILCFVLYLNHIEKQYRKNFSDLLEQI